MELQLNKARIESMYPAFESVFFQEELCEAIIPDSQPDIIKVLDVTSNVLLKSKEAEQGRAIVKGVIQSAVIYAADDDCVYKIDVPMPFTVIYTNQEITPECAILSITDIRSAEAVISNSRKIIVRVNYATSVSSYEKCSFDMCCKTENENIYQLVKTKELAYMSDYTEKTFVISDDILIEEAKDSYFDVLSIEHRIVNSEYSISGNRAIIRGIAETDTVALLSDSIAPVRVCKKTEFSQIIDVDNADELDDIRICIMLTGCYCDNAPISSEEGKNAISIEIHAVAQCELYRKKSVSVLQDLYCAFEEIKCEWKTCAFAEGIDRKVSSVKVSEKIENSQNCIEIVNSKIRFGDVLFDGSNHKVHCIFSAYGFNDKDVPISIKHSFTVNCDEKISGNISVFSTGLYTEISDNEVKFNCEIHFWSDERKTTKIDNLECGLTEESSKWEEAPSAILCRYCEGDTLWSLGKKYVSSVDVIKSINKIEDEKELTAGRLLLIPKV